jgi:nitrite reductase/ring-hydroxylating ferredoxin subunit/uncharacterized membrane protein
MRSKASIKGHPIHPILIPFPIAFLIGTLLFDVLHLTSGNKSYWQTGEYLEIAGIVTALIAAIPGAIVAYVLRNNSAQALIIGLEAIGVILLFISGWLGGTLAYRNQIGVDIRYARAGKWNEMHVTDNNGLIEVATADELKTDQMKLIHIGTKRIVLGKTESGYVAFDDRCCHKGGSLAGGIMICGTVQCPWHGSQFDCSTGVVKAGPAKENIAVYHVQESNGIIYIKY